MPFTILRQDITAMEVDAVVNAANTALQMGGGVCGAIFRAAGARRLQAACGKVGPIRTGGAAVTPGFDLPAKYIIHAAGPVYRPEAAEVCALQLRSAYLESLRLARGKRCRSIAFPLISSGIYGYPKEEALQVAVGAIRDFLDGHDMDVYLAVFDAASFRVSERLTGPVAAYISEHYVDARTAPRRTLLSVEREALEQTARLDFQDALHGAPPPCAPSPPREFAAPQAAGCAIPGLDERVRRLDEPFSAALLKLIDAKGMTDVEVYKRANLDRKLFSKIRTGKGGYTPKKATILALAVALRLTLPETDALLARAGYALSHASKFDVIVEFFLIHGDYDIYEINEVLFQYDQPLLGG